MGDGVAKMTEVKKGTSIFMPTILSPHSTPNPFRPHPQSTLSVMPADTQFDPARFTLFSFFPHSQQAPNTRESSFPQAVTDSSSKKLPNAPAGNLSLWFLPCCLLVPNGGKI